MTMNAKLSMPDRETPSHGGRQSIKLIVCLGLFVTVGSVRSARSEAMENIAIGKPYTFSEPPSQALSMDEGDSTDLTNGVLSELGEELRRWWTDDSRRAGTGYWIDKGTVGWGSPGPVHITIDLGKVEPIKGAALRTAAGTSGAVWPSSIAVLVSEDGESFYLAGDLSRMAQGPLPRAFGTYLAHTFRTLQMRTKGRYVRFVLVLPARTQMCDELEVYRGDDAYLELDYPGKPVELEHLISRDRLTRLGCYRRFRRDTESVQVLVERSQLDGSVRTQLHAELDELRKEVDQSSFPVGAEGFRAIVPYNELHRRIFRAHARLLTAQGMPPTTIWHSHPYRMLSLFELPGEPLDQLRLPMMQKERRAEVFNVTNASGHAKEIRFRITNLPGGPNPDYIEPHQVEYVDTRQGEVVATALVSLKQEGGEYVSDVAAGMTRQIWISVDHPEIPPGRHRGQVTVRCDNLKRRIGFDLSIAPLQFPDEADCSLGMWDYLHSDNTPRYGTTPQNRPAAIQDMTEHRLDVVWGEWDAVPQIKAQCGVGKAMWDFDEHGNLNANLDFSGWDAFVKMWPKARFYLLFHPFGPGDTFAGMEQGSDAFNRAVSQFAARWAEHNRELGLRPKQAGVLFMDEPGNDAMLRTTYHFAKAVRMGTDEILLWTDPGVYNDALRDLDLYTDPLMKSFRTAMEQCDALCPNIRRYRQSNQQVQDYFRELQAQGKLFWFYTAGGPTRTFNAGHYRFQPWYAQLYGATGVGYWAYADVGGNPDSWNTYTAISASSFTPVYFSPDTVTTTKHWEASLEGIQDYQYLAMLKDRFNELKATGVKSDELRRAEHLVRTLAKTVTDRVESQFGKRYQVNLYDNPSAIAEEARVEVLAVLTELQPIQ